MTAQRTAPTAPTAHLDSAGTGRMPDAVRAVLADATAHDDRYGTHALEERLGGLLHTGVHERVGALLGVPAAHTVLATGAAAAFEAYAAHLALGPRDRLWTTPHEGVDRLATLYSLRDRTRARLEVVPLRPDGDLDLDWMREHIDEDVALVSLVHVSAACGTVHPVEEVGRILAPHRARYTVDASYSVGRIPVDAARIGCHLLTADGWRYLRGPYETGFAYADPTAWPDPLPLPAPEPEAPAVAALHAALVHHAAAGALPYDDQLARLRTALAGLPGVELIAPGRRQAGIVAFRHRTVPAAQIRRGLARRGVVVHKGVAQEHPLHPAARDGALLLRASVHHDTTAEEVDRLALALREVLREERAAPAAPAPVRALAAAGADHPGGGTPSPRGPLRRGHLTLHSNR
jgi:selenocysteine lyase/cysteine desulfurase